MRLAVLVLTLVLPLVARAQGVTVFAAASLTNALRDISQLWERESHSVMRLSFAASSTLARQIEQGAPANLFASADEQWMDYLDKRGLIVSKTRVDLLGNDLVLVVPRSRPEHVTIDPRLNLTALLGPNGRLAMGDPAHVPAGIYGKQALTRLGLWGAVSNRIAAAEDVRSALLLVERGEAPAGIVYGTDAATSDSVMIAGVFPPDSHDPIRYPVAIVKTGETPSAHALMHFLQGSQAREIFVRRGFKVE